MPKYFVRVTGVALYEIEADSEEEAQASMLEEEHIFSIMDLEWDFQQQQEGE